MRHRRRRRWVGPRWVAGHASGGNTSDTPDEAARGARSPMIEFVRLLLNVFRGRARARGTSWRTCSRDTGSPAPSARDRARIFGPRTGRLGCRSGPRRSSAGRAEAGRRAGAEAPHRARSAPLGAEAKGRIASMSRESPPPAPSWSAATCSSPASSSGAARSAATGGGDRRALEPDLAGGPGPPAAADPGGRPVHRAAADVPGAGRPALHHARPAAAARRRHHRVPCRGPGVAIAHRGGAPGRQPRELPRDRERAEVPGIRALPSPARAPRSARIADRARCAAQGARHRPRSGPSVARLSGRAPARHGPTPGHAGRGREWPRSPRTRPGCSLTRRRAALSRRDLTLAQAAPLPGSVAARIAVARVTGAAHAPRTAGLSSRSPSSSSTGRRQCRGLGTRGAQPPPPSTGAVSHFWPSGDASQAARSSSPRPRP